MGIAELTAPTAAAPADLFVTDELDRRPRRHTGAARERAAIRDLADLMAQNPGAVLPRLVALAMELTGATSAGLSLYESEPAPGLFRWRHLHGVLAPFEDATTPRDHSPCGVTLDRNAPVLCRHPERFYEWIAEENLIVPEGLLVPLHIGSDEPLGTLWIVADRIGRFCRDDARVAGELAGFVATALLMVQRQDRLRSALDEQEVLAREMSHRLKNLFAMTEGMIRLTARNAETPAAMADKLCGRLRAMADAHALIRRRVSDIGASAATEATDLDGLIRAVVLGHEAGDAPRFTFAGPPVECGRHAVNGVALLVHELATNAAKYGALSRAGGCVDIAWRIAGEDLLLDWRESGGPEIAGAPERAGFGTTLARRTVTGQFGGAFAQDWRREGLACSVRLSLAKLAL